MNGPRWWLIALLAGLVVGGCFGNRLPRWENEAERSRKYHLERRESILAEYHQTFHLLRTPPFSDRIQQDDFLANTVIKYNRKAAEFNKFIREANDYHSQSLQALPLLLMPKNWDLRDLVVPGL